jgi:hypothetical protein
MLHMLESKGYIYIMHKLNFKKYNTLNSRKAALFACPSTTLEWSSFEKNLSPIFFPPEILSVTEATFRHVTLFVMERHQLLCGAGGE